MPAAADSSTRPDVALVTLIADTLEQSGRAMTAAEIRASVRHRMADVLESLASPAFCAELEATVGRRSRKVYRLAPMAVQARGTLGNGSQPRPSGCDRILERLRRGPATHHELYALHCVVHSRIAELRRRGFVIDCVRDGDVCDETAVYVYTLVPATAEKVAA